MTVAPKRSPKPRKAKAKAGPSAGERLFAELTNGDDKFSLTFLIEQAAHTADHLERINEVLRGDRQSWLELRIGAKTVEVVVTDLVRQHRQCSEQLRKLMFEIHRQRAAIPSGPDDDDVTADI